MALLIGTLRDVAHSIAAFSEAYLIAIIGPRTLKFQLSVFTVRLCEAYTVVIAVEILSVCLSVCLSNACIVTKRKHLAKKVQL